MTLAVNFYPQLLPRCKKNRAGLEDRSVWSASQPSFVYIKVLRTINIFYCGVYKRRLNLNFHERLDLLKKPTGENQKISMEKDNEWKIHRAEREKEKKEKNVSCHLKNIFLDFKLKMFLRALERSTGSLATEDPKKNKNQARDETPSRVV